MSFRVFITGTSSGLGYELARTYLEKGAIVGLVSRREEASFKEKYPNANYFCADVRNPVAMLDAANDFTRLFGCPDIVIANAGISTGNLTDFAEDTEIFKEILETNLLGIVNTFQPFLSAMKKRKSGILAGVASVAGFRGIPGASAYSASKSDAISYLESLRVELHNSGINVITLCPGYIETPMTQFNPYPMPFIIKASYAASLIEKAVAQKRGFYVFPWQMSLAAKVLKLLPNPLYDFLFSKVKHKPRRQQNPDSSNSSERAK